MVPCANAGLARAAGLNVSVLNILYTSRHFSHDSATGTTYGRLHHRSSALNSDQMAAANC